MEDDIAGKVVEFYATAEVYLGTLRDYGTESERFYQLGGDEVAEEKARTYLKQVKSSGPEITKFTYSLCEKLCRASGVEFRAPTVAVAAEGLTSEHSRTSPEGANAQAH